MSDYRLELGEVRALIQGKFDFRLCLDCGGKGHVLCDGDLGLVVSSDLDASADPCRYYYDQCDTCEGLGGNLRFT